MKAITLTSGKPCKCILQPYTGDDGKDYLVDKDDNVYSSSEQRVKGRFTIIPWPASFRPRRLQRRHTNQF